MFKKNPHLKLFAAIFLIIGLGLGTLTFDLYKNHDKNVLVYIYAIFKMFLWSVLGVLVKKLYVAIYKDELTELWNRRYLHIILDYEMKKLKNSKSLALAVIDIDDFKSINDNYGHIQGDNVLLTLSNLFKKNVRRSDMVFRWGGEEFIIILPNTDEKGAEIVLERIREKVERYDFNCKITISCGIVSIVKPMEASSFIEMADNALYEAKKVKNNISIYQI